MGSAPFDAKSEQRFAELDSRWQTSCSQLESKIESREADFRTELHAVEVELIEWMFLFWLGTMTTMVALIGFLH